MVTVPASSSSVKSRWATFCCVPSSIARKFSRKCRPLKFPPPYRTVTRICSPNEALSSSAVVSFATMTRNMSSCGAAVASTAQQEVGQSRANAASSHCTVPNICTAYGQLTLTSGWHPWRRKRWRCCAACDGNATAHDIGGLDTTCNTAAAVTATVAVVAGTGAGCRACSPGKSQADVRASYTPSPRVQARRKLATWPTWPAGGRSGRHVAAYMVHQQGGSYIEMVGRVVSGKQCGMGGDFMYGR